MDHVEAFKGDFAELASLMQSSWAENAQEPLLYSARFLESALQQPGASLDFCPAIYDSGALIAFGAGLPRNLRFNGQSCSVLLDSFITVAPAHKGRGLGGLIWSGIAEAAKRNQHDGLITFCVEGDRMNQSLLKFAERYSLPTQKNLAVRYLARPVPKNRGGSIGTADPAIFLRSSEYLNSSIGFARIWSEREAEWQCREREGAFGCSLEHGVISAYSMPTAGAKPALCGLVEDVLWDKLEHADRKQLVANMLDVASAAGIDLLLVPILNYTDLTPFTEAGFRATRRTLQMYLTSWSPKFPLQEVTSAYIDVF
jgi:hypothetical protein